MRIRIPSSDERNRKTSVNDGVTKKAKPSNGPDKDAPHACMHDEATRRRMPKSMPVKGDKLPQRSDVPFHRNRHVRFRLRVIAFGTCFCMLAAFVFSSFLLGYDNGRSVADMSRTVVNATVVPICDALSRYVKSNHVSGTLNGLSRLMTMDVMSVLVAMFVVSVIVAIVVTLSISLIWGIRDRHDCGNVSMMRDYRRRCEACKRIS